MRRRHMVGYNQHTCSISNTVTYLLPVEMFNLLVQHKSVQAGSVGQSPMNNLPDNAIDTNTKKSIAPMVQMSWC